MLSGRVAEIPLTRECGTGQNAAHGSGRGTVWLLIVPRKQTRTNKPRFRGANNFHGHKPAARGKAEEYPSHPAIAKPP